MIEKIKRINEKSLYMYALYTNLINKLELFTNYTNNVLIFTIIWNVWYGSHILSEVKGTDSEYAFNTPVKKG